jgi:hypothetical protein
MGLVNSLLFFAALFVYPIAGFIADRYSRVKVITASEYISAVLLLIFALAPDWKALALGNFLNGLMVFTFPAYSALIADSLPLATWCRLLPRDGDSRCCRHNFTIHRWLPHHNIRYREGDEDSIWANCCSDPWDCQRARCHHKVS